MTISKLEIWNQALSRCGSSQLIQDEAEQSSQRVLAELHYAQARDAVLRHANWLFAKKTEPLALLSEDPPPGWDYLYDYPADCLLMREIVPEDGNGMYLNYRYSDEPNVLGRHFQAFQVCSVGKDRAIAANLEDAYGVYTRRVENAALFPPDFSDAVILSLAGRLCMPLRVDDRRRSQIMDEFRQAMTSAAANDLNESSIGRAPTGTSVLARR